MNEINTCCDGCGKEVFPVGIGTGYGRLATGETLCYQCCADSDALDMVRDGRATLYLSGREVVNWPGTLRFKLSASKAGHHNIAGVRTDVWFTAFGQNWHGVQYGHHSQLCHCRVTK